MDDRRHYKICMVTPEIIPVHTPRAKMLRFFTIARVMREKGNEIYFISRNTHFKLAFTEENGFKNYKIPSINIRWVRKILFMLSLSFTLAREVKKERPDVIFVNSDLCGLAIALHKKIIGGYPVHYDVMGLESAEVKLIPRNKLRSIPESIFYHFLESLLIKNVDILTTINNTHKKILEKFTNKPIYVIRDAVDVSKFDIDNSNSKFVKRNDELLLTFVGGLTNRKLDTLFEIIPSLLKKVPNLKVMIIGTGSDYEYYLKRAGDLGIFDKNIFFGGYVPDEDLGIYLFKSDILYSDAWTRIGFPFKIFEYMLFGKAIITHDVESVREVLSDGVNALLVKDKEDLLQQIILLAEDTELREKLGRNAKELVMKEHTWERRGEKIISIYNTMIIGG
jgi:glycosyltransferase involved in cell wall biosynthesis